ncbi:MAG: 23S rRNA (pseudouridine1915-N3)-methyltransferase [Gammaproteobacteria bacterium]|nr:MAG: 23S rRNA (pseudouridine1915-N3)-methyltransferase [Gammaproteobacteria bacterium]TND06288.1 MAG: 23S rRNA (pseudouridine1915-N3)-methyltransferase [Gammaproteobacteria bacterium]
MRIDLISVGQRMPGWVADGFNEFAQRLPRECALHLVEIPAVKRAGGVNEQKAMAMEGARMLAAVPDNALVVALDVNGESFSSAALSGRLDQWLHSGCNVALLVGGADGLAPACLTRAGQRWSLSPLTLPHMLVRILVAEQIYRAWSILKNHPYHRA